MPDPLFHVVLVRPEIPNNAGNIGRTCMALASALHLVHPLAFDTDEKEVRRAGMDYWDELDVREHASLDAYLGAHSDARLW
ncbi:MAG: TrmH family RNA methyltransferase, partial [Planctomycetota bacterium]